MDLISLVANTPAVVPTMTMASTSHLKRQIAAMYRAIGTPAGVPPGSRGCADGSQPPCIGGAGGGAKVGAPGCCEPEGATKLPDIQSCGCWRSGGTDRTAALPTVFWRKTGANRLQCGAHESGAQYEVCTVRNNAPRCLTSISWGQRISDL